LLTFQKQKKNKKTKKKQNKTKQKQKQKQKQKNKTIPTRSFKTQTKEAIFFIYTLCSFFPFICCCWWCPNTNAHKTSLLFILFLVGSIVAQKVLFFFMGNQCAFN
jgi:uncharacterized membrane protein YbjE (DUF340 family)